MVECAGLIHAGPRRHGRERTDGVSDHHIDWRDDPPRRDRQGRLPPSHPGRLRGPNAEVDHRVRAAIEPYLAAGWEPDGDLWAAIAFDTRERHVLLPTPGLAGQMWDEYLSADVRLRRRTPVAEEGRA